MENNNLFETVRAFTANNSGVEATLIHLKTTLEADLGVTGQDGEDFMWAFFKEFDVDYSDFELDNYFGPEGFPPINLTLLLKRLFGLQFSKRKPFYDITVADLVNAAKEKRWIIPVL